MKLPAYNKDLRTVTAPGGKAVLLSKAEMMMFDALALCHPEPVIFIAVPAQRRHVFMHRLRAKLEKIGCGVEYSDHGYTLCRLRPAP